MNKILEIDNTNNKIIKCDCGAIISYDSNELITKEITSSYTKKSLVCLNCKCDIFIVKIH